MECRQIVPTPRGQAGRQLDDYRSHAKLFGTGACPPRPLIVSKATLPASALFRISNEDS